MVSGSRQVTGLLLCAALGGTGYARVAPRVRAAATERDACARAVARSGPLFQRTVLGAAPLHLHVSQAGDGPGATWTVTCEDANDCHRGTAVWAADSLQLVAFSANQASPGSQHGRRMSARDAEACARRWARDLGLAGEQAGVGAQGAAVAGAANWHVRLAVGGTTCQVAVDARTGSLVSLRTWPRRPLRQGAAISVADAAVPVPVR